MAQITVDKFVYHTPLDRQRKKFQSQYAVSFSESWMCDQIDNVAFWCEPLYKKHVHRLLSVSYLCADETPIPVLSRDKKGKTHRGYFWVYYDPLDKITIFDYRKSRSMDGPNDFLKDFRGTLQIDGYEGYASIIARNGLHRAACMDHVRRKFEQAMNNDPLRARYALDKMREWYQVEAQARERAMSDDERLSLRIEQTVPSMQEFGNWLSDNLHQVLPKSGIGVAISYALGQWKYFQPFMADGRIALSNILTENQIRPVAIGRKNYMFIGSHEAAVKAGMIYSLAATAKNHGIDPYIYFREILTAFPAAKNTDIVNDFLLPQWKPPVNKDTSHS